MSTKVIELGSCAFRQWRATSHCNKIHGYQLKAKIWFTADTLDDKNWVQDFGGLKDVKTLLQNTFDHTLCVAQDDPYLQQFQNLHDLGVVDLRVFENGVGIERTAEYCYKVVDQFVRDQSNGRVSVAKVEVFEHPDNSAVYEVTSAVEVTTTAGQPPGDTTLEASLAQVEVPQPTPQPVRDTAAPVGNRVTSGKGNFFAGTSWGT